MVCVLQIDVNDTQIGHTLSVGTIIWQLYHACLRQSEKHLLGWA